MVGGYDNLGARQEVGWELEVEGENKGRWVAGMGREEVVRRKGIRIRV